jgi:NADH-quinone oxidoreductase subunit N
MLMLPEIVVCVTALTIVVVDLLLSEARRVWLAPLALVGLALAFLATLLTPQTGEMLGGRFGMDPVAWWFKLLFLFAGFVSVILSKDQLDGRARVPAAGFGARGEYYTLLLATVVGMMYLISARDLITLYVSLELATVPLFVLAAWQRDNAISGEAGLKYLIVGALASAFILYGLALLYGLTGQTDLVAMGRLLRPSAVLWLAAGLVTAGVGFKLTLVPFHMWAADVYQGAPTPVTAYLSVASKAAGLAFMFQLFFRVLSADIQHWAMALALLAAVTMTLGNVVAIWQQNIKRFMAFSAISQAGYLIMGFLGPSADGVPAMLFYLLVYSVTNLGVFACIIWYANETGREEINDYRGLSRTNPLMALAMMIGLFSLAGIPPLSGFVGKFFLFSIASKADFHWLVALAAVNSTISLYYYLRIVRQMYMEPTFEGATRLPAGRSLAVTIGALTVGTVLIGVVPLLYERISAETITWLSPLMRP